MTHLTRRLVPAAASVAVFALCVWLVMAAPFGWLPSQEESRWGVALAFAGVVATACGTAVSGWSAGGGPPPGPRRRRRVRQRARASGGATVVQAGRDLGPRGGGAGPAPDDVDQGARASRRGRIVQSGRDQDRGNRGR